MAKVLPKPEGSLVDMNTGVKSSAVAAGAQEDFSRLYNIIKLTDKIKAINERKVLGVFNDKDAAEYLMTRKQVVDEMQRMQSGAALTEEETAFYADYLPGRFNFQILKGVSSGDRIQNFQNDMRNKLDNRLKNNGLSIYGFSKVNVGGNEYVVGSTVVNEAGQEARVLPDGTFYTSDAEEETGGVSSVVIPRQSKLSYVNNNPGNLRFAGQPGATRGQGGFAKFPSPQAGLVALQRQVRLDAQRGHTVASFIAKYAPPTENDTKNYIARVTKTLKVPASTLLSEVNLQNLIAAVVRQESGTILG
jgi:hypothetical protein